jgi:predicted phosphohydrolase
MTEMKSHEEFEKEVLGDDREIRYTYHKPRWWEQWISPTSVAILVGAIVWGIQLNFATLENSKDIGSLTGKQEKLIEMQHETAAKMERITTVLENLEERHREHLDEAALWKERILENSTYRQFRNQTRNKEGGNGRP